MNLKVVTLNTWMFAFYEEILAFLRQEDPDVVFLQEVTSGLSQTSMPLNHGIPNGFEKLRHDLNQYYSLFAPIRLYQQANRNVWMGQAILSKHAFYESSAIYYWENLEVLKIGDDEKLGVGHSQFPGLLLGIKVRFNGTQVEFLNTHFLWSMYPEITDRQRQGLANLLDILKTKENLILGGDFNITDESEIYQGLTQMLIDDRPEQTTRTLHPEIHVIGTSKDLAVDYLFHKGDRLTKVSSHIPLLPLSDHLPIIADYQLS